MIIAHIKNHGSKSIRFSLDSTLEVNNKLLFSVYNKRNSPPIYTADYSELKVLGKGMVTLNMLLDSKFKVVNFYNIFYVLELEYNFFSVTIIKKASYLILAKKVKIRVFDKKNNVTF